MSIASEIADGLTELETDMADTCTIGSDSGIACVASSHRRGEQLEIGGKVVTIRNTLFIRASLLSATPAQGNVITFRSVKYRVAEVSLTAPQSHYEIAITDLSERR